MLLTILAVSILAILAAGLIAGALTIRRRQRTLNAQREAAQLQRRADHLFKIALAAQVHTTNDTIAQTLLEEAARVLEHSLRLDASAESAIVLLRECNELIASTASNVAATTNASDPFTDFPETELIEAQMHLTEAARLLTGFEKRGLISFDTLQEMGIALKQAQRAIDLRLQLMQASRSIGGERESPKFDETVLRGEYLAAAERNRRP